MGFLFILGCFAIAGGMTVFAMWMSDDLHFSAQDESTTSGEREWEGYLTHHIPGYGKECNRSDFGL